MPLGGWFYLLLRKEVPDRTIRVAFSAGSSYALTTLFYLRQPRFIVIGFSILCRLSQGRA